MKLVGGSNNLTLRCKSWSEELEKLACTFGEDVESLLRCDSQVLRQRGTLEKLQCQLAYSFAEHCRVSRQLDIMENHQLEIDSILHMLSSELDKMESSIVASNDDRELLFSFGEDVSSKLRSVTQLLSQKLAVSTELSSDTNLDPIFQLLKLQLRQLQFVEQKIQSCTRVGDTALRY
jgi:hypothetical protein